MGKLPFFPQADLSCPLLVLIAEYDKGIAWEMNGERRQETLEKERRDQMGILVKKERSACGNWIERVRVRERESSLRTGDVNGLAIVSSSSRH